MLILLDYARAYSLHTQGKDFGAHDGLQFVYKTKAHIVTFCKKLKTQFRFISPPVRIIPKNQEVEIELELRLSLHDPL